MTHERFTGKKKKQNIVVEADDNDTIEMSMIDDDIFQVHFSNF